MYILDRYILKEFIKGLFLCLVALIFVYIVVDLFDHISRFIDKGVGIFGILQYYIYELPSAINLLCPMAILIACFVSVGNMSRHFELVAIRGSGISSFRITLPLVVLGCIITICMFIAGQTLVPRSLEAKEKFKREKIDKLPLKKVRSTRNVYFVGEDNRFYKIDFVDGSNNTVRGITVYTFLDDMRLVERIDAESGTYERPVWIFHRGIIRRWDKTDNTEWASKFDSIKVDWLKEGVDAFLQERKKPETMNYIELRRYIDFRRRGGYDVTGELSDLYYMISYQFINLIIILLGVPLAEKVRTSGLMLGFAVAMFSSFLYWGFTQLGRAFGKAGIISPALGSWLPNIIFAIAGAMLIIDNVRR